MIRPVIFESFAQGEMKEKRLKIPSRFSVVKKYPQLYAAYREQKENIRPFYGHPYTEKIIKPYYGTDRSGGCLFRDELKKKTCLRDRMLMLRLRREKNCRAGLKTEADANRYLELQEHPEEYEIIHTRLAGTTGFYPRNYAFLGFDVSYMTDADGAFSIISDCLFLPQWHGCDEDGTLFSDDYAKLNENGLFLNWDDAYAYLVKYRNEDWSEMGWFGIYEVRRKKADDQ